ncbi:MAG: DedA family protein [Frankiaceae bacterium]
MPPLAHPLASLLGFDVLSAQDWATTVGQLGVILIIFCETGILLGIFLPGDSLLFTAGVLCAQTVGGVHFNLAVILIGTSVAAVLGGMTGYLIGTATGPRLFERSDSRWFKREWLVRVNGFLERYGVGKALLLARFVPVVRTLINPFVGILAVDPRRFGAYNLIGGVAWAVLVTMLGYALGNSLPKGKSIDSYILPVVAAIVLISVIPIGVELVRNRRRRAG